MNLRATSLCGWSGNKPCKWKEWASIKLLITFTNYGGIHVTCRIMICFCCAEFEFLWKSLSFHANINNPFLIFNFIYQDVVAIISVSSFSEYSILKKKDDIKLCIAYTFGSREWFLFQWSICKGKVYPKRYSCW